MSRSAKVAAVLLVLAGGLLTVLAAGRRWLVLSLPPGVDAAGVTQVVVTGRQAAPAAAALGLVALAGAVVLAVAGRVLRTLVGVLLTGAGLAVIAVTVTLDDARSRLLADALARATGARTGLPPGSSATTTGWPYLSAAGGLLVVSAALLVLLRGHRWDGPARRFEPAGVSPRSGGDGMQDAWDALSAGRDPTDDGWHNGRDPSGGDP